MNTVHKDSIFGNFIEHLSGKTETPARLLAACCAGMLWQKTKVLCMGWLRLFKGELVREAQQWVEQGLVQRDQAERILERFDTSFDDRRHWSLGYVVLVGLAILSLGLALFLLVSHNWDDWPRAARMTGLVLVTLGLNVQGIRCYAQGRTDTGTRWLFAGAFSYGASIMLVAQIDPAGHSQDGERQPSSQYSGRPVAQVPALRRCAVSPGAGTQPGCLPEVRIPLAHFRTQAFGAGA